MKETGTGEDFVAHTYQLPSTLQHDGLMTIRLEALDKKQTADIAEVRVGN